EGIRISRILDRLEQIGKTADHPNYRHAVEALATITSAAGVPSDGPVSIASAIVPMPGGNGRVVRPIAEELEIVHRDLENFPDNTGYDENFLEGHPLLLPQPTTALRKELARRLDDPNEVFLPFRHFTTVMHA